jgi:hypothetical protein
MGVNVIVIVENSRDTTLDAFRDFLLQDKDLGPLVWNSFEDDTMLPWEEFTWEGKKYFSWIFTPRFTYLNLYRQEGEAPTPIQITFFRCMLLVEQAAGGPIHVGNDIIDRRTPSDFPEEPFWLPFELDAWWPNWREIAQTPLDPNELGLIF